MKIICPVCKKDIYCSLKFHLIQLSKIELFNREFYDLKETPHTDYFRDKLEKVITTKVEYILK